MERADCIIPWNLNIISHLSQRVHLHDTQGISSAQQFHPGPTIRHLMRILCLAKHYMKIIFPINTEHCACFFTTLRTHPAGWKRCLLFELITFALFCHPDGFLFIFFYLSTFLALAKEMILAIIFFCFQPLSSHLPALY